MKTSQNIEERILIEEEIEEDKAEGTVRLLLNKSHTIPSHALCFPHSPATHVLEPCIRLYVDYTLYSIDEAPVYHRTVPRRIVYANAGVFHKTKGM